MNRNQFIIVFALAAGGMFCAALFVAVLVLPYFMSRQRGAGGMPAMPASLTAPGVRQGTGLLLKSVWLHQPAVGEVTDIRFGEFERGAGAEYGVAGRVGAVFADEAGRIRTSTRFAVRASHVDLIDVDGDRICEFLDRGGNGWQDAALLDHAGSVVWKIGGGIDDMAAGDVDGDGVLEFTVGYNGGGGVHLLDKTGHKRWEQPEGNAWHVEMADTDGDGRLEIINSNAAGEITVRDGTGKLIRAAKPPAYFSNFSLCAWPGRADPLLPIYAENDHVFIIGYDGAVKGKFNAPDCGDLGNAVGTLVRLRSSEPEYLAVAVVLDNWNRSILYVYDSSGKLVYREVLDQICRAAGVRPIGSSGQQALLVGATGQVLEYKSAPEPIKAEAGEKTSDGRN